MSPEVIIYLVIMVIICVTPLMRKYVGWVVDNKMSDWIAVPLLIAVPMGVSILSVWIIKLVI